MPHKFLTDIGVKFIKEYKKKHRHRLNISKIFQQIQDDHFYDEKFNHKIFCIKCTYINLKNPYHYAHDLIPNFKLIIVEPNSTIRQFLYKIYDFYNTQLPPLLMEFIQCSIKNKYQVSNYYMNRCKNEFQNAQCYKDLMIEKQIISDMKCETSYGMINLYYDIC